MAVHSDGAVIAVWEEVTGVRKRTVMRVSLDRGRTFGSVQILSDGAKAETPTVAVHPNGTIALAWSEHAWPHNRLVVQWARSQMPALERLKNSFAGKIAVRAIWEFSDDKLV